MEKEQIRLEDYIENLKSKLKILKETEAKIEKTLNNRIKIQEELIVFERQLSQKKTEILQIDEDLAQYYSSKETLEADYAAATSKKNLFNDQIEDLKSNFSCADENMLMCQLCAHHYTPTLYPCLVVCCGNSFCIECVQKLEKCALCRKPPVYGKNLALLHVATGSLRKFGLFNDIMVLFEKKTPSFDFFKNVSTDKISQNYNLLIVGSTIRSFDFAESSNNLLSKKNTKDLVFVTPKGNYAVYKTTGSGNLYESKINNVKVPLNFGEKIVSAACIDEKTHAALTATQQIALLDTANEKIRKIKVTSKKGLLVGLNSKTVVILEEDALYFVDLEKGTQIKTSPLGNHNGILKMTKDSLILLTDDAHVLFTYKNKTLTSEHMENLYKGKLYKVTNDLVICVNQEETFLRSLSDKSLCFELKIEGKITGVTGCDKMITITTDNKEVLLFDHNGKQINKFEEISGIEAECELSIYEKK